MVFRIHTCGEDCFCGSFMVPKGDFEINQKASQTPGSNSVAFEWTNYPAGTLNNQNGHISAGFAANDIRVYDWSLCYEITWAPRGFGFS